MQQEILEIWQSKSFQIGMDLCRILLVVISLFILYQLITNIEEVKQINDPIKYFETKTNSTCECYRGGNIGKINTYPMPNISEWNKFLINETS